MEEIVLRHNKKTFKKVKNIAIQIVWANIIWYAHAVFVFGAISLFFIPLSIMPNRIEFQFYYLWGIIVLQSISGIIYLPKTKRFHFVCPLTAMEKHLVKKHPHKHVGESCIADFCAEKIGLPKWLGTISVIICLGISTAQYFRLI